MFRKIIFLMFAFVLHFIPRDKHLWLTGKISSWEYNFEPPKFFDNSKYFYLYLLRQKKEKVYWISSSAREIEMLKEMGLPVVRFDSFRGMFLTLRAKYFFHHYGINQINDILQLGGTHIDFWHGTPLKKIRYDVVEKEAVKRRKIVEFLDKNSIEYVSSTSRWLSESILSHAFDLPLEQFINFGYPRMDIMKMSKAELMDFCKQYSKELVKYLEITDKFSKVFLYMPTWRDDDPDYFRKANIDFEKLCNRLHEIDAVFFLKLHPLTKSVEIKDYDNIFIIGNDVDIYPFLPYTDFLVTDYSSIYFDYLVLDKEIIFVPYDYENYVGKRELYFDYDKVTPGIKYDDFDSFIDGLPNVFSLDYVEQRKRIKDMFIENYNFDACEKTYEFFREKQ